MFKNLVLIAVSFITLCNLFIVHNNRKRIFKVDDDMHLNRINLYKNRKTMEVLSLSSDIHKNTLDFINNEFSRQEELLNKSKKEIVKTSKDLADLNKVLYKELHKWKPKHSTKFVRRFQALNYSNKTYGSGFNIKHLGKYYVISNRHVCEVSNQLRHGTHALVNGKLLKILKVSNKHDLCALESDMKDGVELARQDVEPLDKITLIGHPRGLDMVIREGRIISEDKNTCVWGDSGINCRPSDMISALAYGGNSGSPVFNDNGRVIGVLYAGVDMYPHEPMVVPYEFLKEFLNELIKE